MLLHFYCFYSILKDFKFIVSQLVEVNAKPRIKVSQEVSKVTIPGKKIAYRLYGKDNNALVDLLQHFDEPAPQEGQKVKCLHPFEASKRAWVTPSKVETLHECQWKNGRTVKELTTLANIRKNVQDSLANIREDHKRLLNPTPYKVSVSENLYKIFHDLWNKNEPIGELFQNAHNKISK